METPPVPTSTESPSRKALRDPGVSDLPAQGPQEPCLLTRVWSQTIPRSGAGQQGGTGLSQPGDLRHRTPPLQTAHAPVGCGNSREPPMSLNRPQGWGGGLEQEALRVYPECVCAQDGSGGRVRDQPRSLLALWVIRGHAVLPHPALGWAAVRRGRAAAGDPSAAHPLQSSSPARPPRQRTDPSSSRSPRPQVPKHHVEQTQTE